MDELTIEKAGALAPLVTPEVAAKTVASGAVLIDVRSAAGRASAGVLPGAAVVGKDEVAELLDPSSSGHLVQVESLATPVVVICGSVRGSGPVAAQLIALGFTDVAHVEGGFPAWKEAGLPTEPPEAE